METMKAVQLTGIRKMELTNIPKPKIQSDNEALLKLKTVGVCGSDVHYYLTGRIGSQVVEYPFLVGHECSAIVAEVGKSVSRVNVGDLVAVDPAMVCHQCDQCRVGRENTCRNLKFLGCPGQAEGCLCEYIVMPEDSLFPVDSSKISAEQAAIAEPLSIGVYAVKQAHIEQSSDISIAIFGSGPIGLSVLVSALANGIKKIYMTDKIDERLSAAKSAGALLCANPLKGDVVKEILSAEPLGVDVAFECAGQQETIDEAVELLKPGGKLMLIGIPETDRISFAIDRIRRKEITIINVRRQNKCVQPALDIIAEKRADVDFMVTHRFPLEKTQEAFELVADYRDGVIKAMIEISNS